ncbi:GntR family transcriptional regulator [Opitutaceae bacterium]|nr:GntR family transcriptional regulator [Opitutaceae bacterium]
MSDQPIFRTIREQVVERLRNDVMGQVFEPGESLREFALAKRYAVSRSPIRDALLQLTQEGLLVATPNCGVKVASRMDDEVQPLVVDIRLRVEKFALDRVMKNVSETALALLRERLERNHTACREGVLSNIIKSDMDFHEAIVEEGGSEKLIGLWKQVTSAMMLHYERHGDWIESYREHVAIFEAIERGDRKAAKAALVTNIQ